MELKDIKLTKIPDKESEILKTIWVNANWQYRNEDKHWRSQVDDFVQKLKVRVPQ